MSLTPEQLVELKALLEQQQQRLLEDIAGIHDDAATVDLDQQKVGRLSRMDALQMQSMAQANESAARLALSQTELALAKISNDDYGYCTECDENIGYARLSIKPETPLCIKCQEKTEH